MNITLSEDNRIFVTASELSHYARSGRKSSLSFSEVGDMDTLATDFQCECDAIISTVTVTAVADMVYSVPNAVCVEKVFTRGRISTKTQPSSDSASFAESIITAYIVAVRKNVSTVKLRITYTNENHSSRKTYECTFELGFLKNTTEALVKRALPFIKTEAEKLTRGLKDLKALPFPYKSIRPAQKEFITEAYRTIKHGDRLLVTAPTGVGKTISALYPALRAVGSRQIDKIFYLTAKTETGIAARDAIREMTKSAPTLRCVTILAKERVCPFAFTKPSKQGSKCRFCALTKEIGGISYEQRRDAALIELLDKNIIDTVTIQSVASKYSLCPYELSLDISEFAEVVICDYNYVFDPHVRFKRYFKDMTQLRYAFLIDEAHNLADRAREMYSATLDTDIFLRLYKYGSELFPAYEKLNEAITDVAGEIGGIVKLCREEELEIDSENSAGFYISSEIPTDLIKALESFISVAKQISKSDDAAAEELEEAVEVSASLISSASIFDGGFRFFAELINSHLTISAQCLDPSAMLDKMMKSAVSSIMFSATLTPMEYFADILGSNDAETLELDSPYDKENLCLIAFDSISTRYQDRRETAEDIAEVILSTIEAKEGNYIAYFPSYDFMKKVYSVFTSIAPDVNSIIQKSNMTNADRKAFLASFKTDGEAVVGFCVLGGVFSEGVDLKGERLIGTIIVGTGLPKITSSQNILKDYFDSTRENGFAYAYKYPAMIKVLQAAGRVIRSEEDCGVVVLVDDRYAEPDTYRLFPKMWKHIKYTGDPFSLSVALENFWESHDK